MEAYLNAMCRWQSALDTISDSKRRFEERREMLEAYREIADSFPSSVYSKQMRVEYIADLYQRVWVEGYNRRAATDYALTYIVDYPDEVSALRFVREFSNMGHERTELKFLRDVSAAVPGTRAGELAKRLLDHPDER